MRTLTRGAGAFLSLRHRASLWPVMDTDPTLDLHPPRYAVESDSEDEYDQAVHRPHQAPESPNIELSLAAATPLGTKLLISCGHAGTEWSHGVQLGPKVGTLLHRSLAVGLIHSPNDECIVLQMTHILPVSSCYQAASVIISKLKPSSVAILDSYPAPSYISDSPRSMYESPMRILKTTAARQVKSTSVEAFSPPNLVQRLPAALLSLLESLSVPAWLVLLPALHIPPPAPLLPVEESKSNQQSWTSTALRQAHDVLTSCIAITVSRAPSDVSPHASSITVRPPRVDVVGEGGMYI